MSLAAVRSRNMSCSRSWWYWLVSLNIVKGVFHAAARMNISSLCIEVADVLDSSYETIAQWIENFLDLLSLCAILSKNLLNTIRVLFLSIFPYWLRVVFHYLVNSLLVLFLLVFRWRSTIAYHHILDSSPVLFPLIFWSGLRNASTVGSLCGWVRSWFITPNSVGFTCYDLSFFQPFFQAYCTHDVWHTWCLKIGYYWINFLYGRPTRVQNALINLYHGLSTGHTKCPWNIPITPLYIEVSDLHQVVIS